jgi:hypothetical protein
MAQKKTVTKEKIIWAYEECRKDPGILATCMAEKLGTNPRYMTAEHMKLVADEVFTVEKQGNAYLFKLNPDSLE